MLHHTNLVSLRERGPYGGKGTISETRKFIEKIPVVGYGVRVIDNMIGFNVRMPYYRIKSAIGSGSEVRTLEKELKARESKMKKDREVSEADRMEIERLHAELIKKKELEKEKDYVMPDPVKDASEQVINDDNLAKELANAANHGLLNEVKKKINPFPKRFWTQ
jgi:hypothetical protein